MGYYKEQELVPESREKKIRAKYDECARLKEQNDKLRELLDVAMPCDQKCDNTSKWHSDVDDLLTKE